MKVSHGYLMLKFTILVVLAGLVRAKLGENRDLVSIDDVGSDPVTPLPLERCQGDCDRNSDCAGDLVCFQRSAGDAVPGCDGGVPESNSDFCVRTEDLPPISEPGSTIPLNQCEGDCNSDDDCSGDLVCWQRDPGMSVPGCSGKPSSRTDFCIRIQDIDESIMIKDLGSSPEGPLDMCEGDCDFNSDCTGDLICWQRNMFDRARGCFGDVSTSRTDFCTEPLRLQECGIGCANGRSGNSDCDGNLICYIRNSYGQAPGCPDAQFSNSPDNFCVDPVEVQQDPYPSRDPTPIKLLDSPPKYNLCEGVCVSDDNCNPGLRCRPARTPSFVDPACSGASEVPVNTLVCLPRDNGGSTNSIGSFPDDSGRFRTVSPLSWQDADDIPPDGWCLECNRDSNNRCIMGSRVSLAPCTDDSPRFYINRLTERLTSVAKLGLNDGGRLLPSLALLADENDFSVYIGDFGRGSNIRNPQLIWSDGDKDDFNTATFLITQPWYFDRCLTQTERDGNLFLAPCDKKNATYWEHVKEV